MPTLMPKDDDSLYLVNQKEYGKYEPSGSEDLTSLYGLTPLANSVARFDVVTGEKKKLRKSYKNQIADLYGRHTIPTTQNSWSLLQLGRMPLQHVRKIQTFDQDLMSQALSLDKTPNTGIQGFDVSLLAMPSFASSGASPPANANANASSGGGHSNSPFYRHRNRRAGSNGMTAESSNDDSTVLRRDRKKRESSSQDPYTKRRRME